MAVSWVVTSSQPVAARWYSDLLAELLPKMFEKIISEVGFSCTSLHINMLYFLWIFSILTANKVNVLKFEGIQSMHALYTWNFFKRWAAV